MPQLSPMLGFVLFLVVLFLVIVYFVVMAKIHKEVMGGFMNPKSSSNSFRNFK
uniref:ATP synthase F0 subunit 8 n=1 Tax=Berghia stephanieae TaxID=1287507 RepID=A0A7S7Z970_9GAST|nr:ATP synthase F0 subunit 8 [Berghia stephanieae]